MANLVTYDCKPVLNRPILIEGLPGVGNVGKIAADFISSKLNARRMARILSENLPAQFLINDECVARMACQELWYAKDVNGHDVIFLLGECQSPTNDGQFLMAQTVMDMVLPYDPSMVITLGGYGTGEMPKEPRVMGVVSDAKLKSTFESYGVGFYPGEPEGGVVGAAAALLGLGQAYGIDSVCIIGETSGYILDSKSARNLVDVLANMLGIEIDTSDMQTEIDQIDTIAEQVENASALAPPEDLSYIG